MLYNCSNCKIQFSSKGKARPRKYCSKKCQSIANRVGKICKFCNTEFNVIASSKAVFCSIKCASRGKKSNVAELRKTMLKRYGVEFPSQLDNHLEKTKKTLVKKFGKDYKKKLIKKQKRALLEKYGSENYVNIEATLKTKLEKYGNSTYNNREKSQQTMLRKYDSLISPNSLKSLKIRLASGEQGFGSSKFKQFLENNGVENTSQLPLVRKKKSNNQLREKYNQLTSFPFNTQFEICFSQDEYLGSKDYKKYEFKCLKCSNKFFGYVTNGTLPRCEVCYPIHQKDSIFEKEITEFVKTLIDGVKENIKSVISPLELDIYIPSKNLAIECNGNYWHSELAGKDKNYHLKKLMECEKINIRLIQILQSEWIEHQEVIKSILQTTLASERNTRIFARKCEIREVSSEESARFLNENHLQGADKSSVRIGLYFKNELVQLMTFSTARYDKSIDWEISRSASKAFHTIVGGLGKLWEYFLKLKNPLSVLTYSDRRFFLGTSYETLGFKFEKNTTPSYHYFKNNSFSLQSRMGFQKHKLSNILEVYDSGLTEWDNMKNNGFNRIWDCGHSKYVWKRI